MNITGVCTYETPCGWCAKWDKKCDKKIGVFVNKVTDIQTEYKACWDCEKSGWSMPECAECNPENNFKWKRTKS